ncbi:hypothetical protein [Sorangium sp. So ce1000]|uniref:hypothetical protein n=1 Tax=Sorangium sp. So ce1000 TaxID=3133325 RepID=UPI003F633CC0
MAFHVYPDPQDKPQNIGSGGSHTFDIQQFTPEMVIRVALFAPGSSPTTPTFKVQAGTGDPVTADINATSAIFSAPGSNIADYVGDLGLLVQESGNIYALTISVSASSTWKLTITNNDASPRDFTVVVADSPDDSKRPWVDIDTSLNFDVLVNEGGAATPLALKIRNMGTGVLNVSALNKGGADAAKFTPDALAPVLPNSEIGVNIALTPQTAIGPLAATLTAATNDSTAKMAAGHNSLANLTAVVRRLEVAFLLDASGSMAYGPGGEHAPENSTRWTLLKSGVAAALNVLKNFGDGKGSFAIGMYPDISPYPKHPTDPVGPGVVPVLSPSAADITAGASSTAVPIDASNVTNAINTHIEAHSPRENGGATPIGRGIAQGISTLPSAFGYFDPSVAARNYNRRYAILMSDGNHNSDPPKPLDFYPGGPLPSFQAKGVKALTIAYGSDTATQMLPNKPLLKEISAKAGGTAAYFHDADLDVGTAAITTFIKATVLAGLSLDTLADPTGVLTPANPVLKRQVPVAAHDNKVSFIVSWASPNPRRIRVQVQTPLGELLETAQPGVTVDHNVRFQMLTISSDFLHNKADPGKPRHGTWTLLLTLNPNENHESDKIGEQYDYQVLIDSRLKLVVSLDQHGYAAGEPIKLSARLLLDGVGVPNAAVTLSRVVPTSSLHNFLGKSPLSDGEYREWAGSQRSNPDIDSIAIKASALAAKGIRYSKSTNTDTIPLLDPNGVGTYSGATPNTSVPGTYRFTVTAVGALPDGTLFRREQGVDVLVTVRPELDFSPISVEYGKIVQGGTTFSTATITVRPSDRFGNVVLLDPSIDPTIAFTASVGDFQGPIVDHHDGSYTQTLVYPLGASPSVGVKVGDVDLKPITPLVPMHHLRFVDRVFGFAPGREAAPSMNQHEDPHACVGDPSARVSPTFVSLGAGGSLVVGIGGHYILPARGNEDITVFVRPDFPLRPYSVQVMHGDHFDHCVWEEIGRSPGVTQSFSLRKSLLHSASAIRIVDRSHAVKNADGTPSHTPGVSIVAVGVRHVEEGEGDLDDLVLRWLKHIGHVLFGG